MLSLTVADMVKGYRGDTEGHYLYLYRDGEAVFYVGKSREPCERLLQHLGHVPPYQFDAIGWLIRENMPASLSWCVELYRLAECCELVQLHQPGSLSFFQSRLAETGYDDEAVCVAEDAMIAHYQPHLNVKGRRYHNPLPDRYVKRKVVNEGIIVPPGVL